jgi:WD40 repeat protein
VTAGVSYTPDAQVASSTLTQWDASTGQELLTLETPVSSVHALVYSADGRLVAGADGEAAQVWDAATGRQLWRSLRLGGDPPQATGRAEWRMAY